MIQPNNKDAVWTQRAQYQMQWTNSKPDVEISSIDVAYDEKTKNQFGAPVVLAITVAKEAAK